MEIEEIIKEYCQRVAELDEQIKAERDKLKDAFASEGLQVSTFHLRANEAQLLGALKQARERKRQEEEFVKRETEIKQLVDSLNLSPGQAVRVVYDYSYYSQDLPKTVAWGYFDGVKPNFSKKLCLDLTPRNPKEYRSQIFLGYILEISPTTDPFPVEALKTKRELYERACSLKIPGRSKLSDSELRAAIEKLEEAGEAKLGITDEHPAFVCD